MQAEYKAIVGVIARSLQLTPREVRLMHLRCMSSNSGKSSKDGAKESSDKAKSGEEGFEKQPEKATSGGSKKSSKDAGEQPPSTASSSSDPTGSSSSDPADDPNKNNNENEEKMRSVLTKAVLWLFTIYMFVAFFSLLITPRSERPEVDIP